MRLKMFSALLMAGAAAMSAQGYQDGVDYYNANYPEEAKIILERTVGGLSGADKAVANYYLGQIAYDNGDMAKAGQLFNAGISADADCPYNYIGLGAIALKNGDKDEAEDRFKEAQKLDKGAAVKAAIARVYYNVNSQLYAKEITKLIEKAKKADLKEPTIYILEADMIKGEDVGGAAGEYEMAMNFDKEPGKDGNVDIEHPEAYIKYTKLYETINPKYGIERLNELLTIEPNSAMAQRELAEAYYSNNLFTKAAEQYGTYIQNPNSFQKDRQRYVGLLNFGKKYQESYDLAREILNDDPDNIFMKRMLFMNMALMEKFDEAEKRAHQFFNDPNAAGKYVYNDYVVYGNMLQAQGKDSLAVLQLAKAVKIAPDHKRGDMLKNLSEMQTKAKLYREAAETQQAFVDMGNASVNDLFTLGLRYQNLGATSAVDSPERIAALEKGIAMIDKCIEMGASNFQLPFAKGRMLLMKNGGKNDEASTAAFEETLTLLDKNPEKKDQRANIYLQCYSRIAAYYYDKDAEKARAALTSALEIDSENQGLKELLENLK